MPKVAVVLSGCGFLDGAEIQEAVLSLYFLDRAGAKVQCFAPDRDQMHVVDHLTGKPTGESRNVLHESARIARGHIQPLGEARMADFDALVIPGGFGAAKNLSDFAVKGAAASVDPDLIRLVREAHDARKPMVAICISPAVLALAFHRAGISAKLTIGDDPDAAEAIESLGSHHQNCVVESFVADTENHVISTPAYMLGPGPAAVGAGIEGSISALMSWLRTPVA